MQKIALFFLCLLFVQSFGATLNLGIFNLAIFNAGFQTFLQALSPEEQSAFKVTEASQGHRREENIELFKKFVDKLPNDKKLAGQIIISQINEGAKQWWQMIVEPQPSSVRAAFEKAKQIADSDISAQQLCVEMRQLKRELSAGDLGVIGNVWPDNIECANVKRVVPHPIMQLNMNIEPIIPQ